VMSSVSVSIRESTSAPPTKWRGDKGRPQPTGPLAIFCVRWSNAVRFWIADAHRDDGNRFVVRADEKLTAFLELESAKDKVRPDSKVDHRMKRKRGRPTLFNAGLAARLCRLLERGWTTRACCESERVGLRTFFDWRSRHRSFARATRRGA
jgi:hypothetical protein